MQSWLLPLSLLQEKVFGTIQMNSLHIPQISSFDRLESSNAARESGRGRNRGSRGGRIGVRRGARWHQENIEEGKDENSTRSPSHTTAGPVPFFSLKSIRTTFAKHCE